jgi:hypothetical protein
MGADESGNFVERLEVLLAAVLGDLKEQAAGFLVKRSTAKQGSSAIRSVSR